MSRKKFVFNQQADVKVLFEFNGKRRYAIADGFRTSHAVSDGLTVMGKHHYFCSEFVPPKGRANGTITFLATDKLPPCLWKDKHILILEGEQIIGEATVLQVLNPALIGTPT